MSVYLLAGVRNSLGARLLTAALRAQDVEVRRTLDIPPKKGDVVFCWGWYSPLTLPAGVRGLNCKGRENKLRELQKMKEAGAITPPFSSTPLYEDDGDLKKDWFGRTLWHTGGKDLLKKTLDPDFYVKKVEVAVEGRVHVFKGKSIRLGIKVHDPDYLGTPHPWVRSEDRGWILSYGRGRRDVPESFFPLMRAEAKKALRAVGLDFGGVDVGITLKKGVPSAMVFEVNSMPGQNKKTAAVYAEAIKREAARG